MSAAIRYCTTCDTFQPVPHRCTPGPCARCRRRPRTVGYVDGRCAKCRAELAERRRQRKASVPAPRGECPPSPAPVWDVAPHMGVCIDDQQLALVRLPDKPPFTLWQRKWDGTLVCLSDNWRWDQRRTSTQAT